ncbi:aldehyde dehydrogenase family protein [Burkholderia seminalis]|uniref:Aldehyde dehydrogenase family protein n=2 Tax=Burkholderia cepacia complex TaxID=87882 RepID=A0A8A8DE86_9BURK|nr:aldehyde dehydrogenase family protein [Burkholderia seminalis]QTO23425.1 aldehyde dehydrogenase family protein [Burkholderia seminalis]
MMSFNDDLREKQGFLRAGEKQLLIDGQHVSAASGRTFTSINPATGRVIATVSDGDAVDIDRAVTSARKAFEGPWSCFKPAERQALLLRLADVLDKHYDELASLDTLDMGAPLLRTRASRVRAVGLMRYYAGMAMNIHGDTIPNSVPGNVFSYTVKEPVGVVGAITPWNGPLTLALWKIGPALATGCTVVLKPAEQSPLSSLRLGELCLEAGLPPGVLNVVTGGGNAGAALAAHRGVDKIAFTGSTNVGQKIIEASAGNIKRVSLELGGKSPHIIFADADLDAAVPAAAMAVFANSGQICSAGTRLFVQEAVYDEFVQKVAAFGNGLRVGDPADPDVQLGPLVSEQQLKRVAGYLRAGQEDGAVLLGGGGLPDDRHGLGEGYFVRPTVFAQVHDDMRIAKEEIFGPVISALPFTDTASVIQRANSSDFGLGGGVWTRSLATAQQVTQGLRTGSVWVNCYQAMDPAVPFGGYKMSGYGRESGREHIEEFLNTKAVWINS